MNSAHDKSSNATTANANSTRANTSDYTTSANANFAQYIFDHANTNINAKLTNAV